MIRINKSAKHQKTFDKNNLRSKNPISAHKQASKDMEKDPDFSQKATPEDGLDEGEMAKLEGQDDGEMNIHTQPK